MKLAKKFTVMLTVMAFVMSVMAVTVFAEASIDWEKGVIRATGMAAGKKGETRKGLLRAQARRAARMDAERNLAEQVHGVQVTAESTMKDLELEYDMVKTATSAVLKNMYEVGEPVFEDDVCTITLEIPLWGSNSVASAAFLPMKNQTREPFPQPSQNNPSSVNSGDSAVGGATTGKYTGLIVDCRGLGLKPVMSPVIKNDRGQSIYGHKNLDYDKVIELGMASYVNDTGDSAAARAGDHPIIVKALSVENHAANPVIKISDSDSVLIANQGDHFLDDCAVVFVR